MQCSQGMPVGMPPVPPFGLVPPVPPVGLPPFAPPVGPPPVVHGLTQTRNGTAPGQISRTVLNPQQGCWYVKTFVTNDLLIKGVVASYHSELSYMDFGLGWLKRTAFKRICSNPGKLSLLSPTTNFFLGFFGFRVF